MPSTPFLVISRTSASNFNSAQGPGSIGGHIGITRAAGENDYPSFFEVVDGFSPDIGFGYLLDIQGGLCSGNNTIFFQNILQGEGIDYGSEHAGVICRNPVHAVGFGLSASPDVTAANDNTDADP